MVCYESNRIAFTLVELLVVVAIIGVLVAMTLPAVQAVRESARRTTCQNNLKQLALASLNFESAQGALPNGVNSADATKFRSMSWLTTILPYVEHQNLWDVAANDYEMSAIPFYSHTGLRTVVSNFLCGSDPDTARLHSTHGGVLVASTNYLGVNGTNYKAKDGVFFRDSAVRIAGISDGQSNTLLIGERPPSADYWYGWWYAGVGQDQSGSPDMLLGVGELNDAAIYLESCDNGPNNFKPGRQTNQCDVLHFWSYHPSGGNFARCDGSVQFVTYTIDSSVIRGIATRNGGEVIEE